MRRVLGIVIALLIPALVIGTIALITDKAGLPEMAQSTLDRYLSHLRQAGHPARVVAAWPASDTRRFIAALSGPVFGDGSYYNVLNLNAEPFTPAPTLNSLWAGPAISYRLALTPKPDSGYTNGHPVPYPPEEIWCVQLQPGDNTAAPAVTVLLAHYPKGLYGDSWAVHELPLETAAQTLALLGCASK